MEKLLKENLGTFHNRFIFATWGTYYDAFLDPKEREKLAAYHNEDCFQAYEHASSRWNSRWFELQKGYALRPGKRGGILQMAEHLESSALTDRIETLIFLTDPEDLEESYPEDRALIRSAIRNNVLYLPTYRSASHWAAFEVKDIKQAGQDDVQPTKPEKETLALIAHDGKKLDLCRWVVEHRHRIRRFKSILTTGTTGSWVKLFLKATDVAERKIDLIERAASGPHGGDVEISGEIVRGKCHHVVFFVDPDTPHAHEADIRALLRTCSMPDVEVNLRLTERAATSWISTVTPDNV